MTIITRRAYILRFAAGLGAIFSSSTLHGLAQRRRTRGLDCPRPNRSLGSNELKLRSLAPRIWEPQWPGSFPSYPANQTVKLIFSGLGAFCPNTTGGCDVGFRTAPDEDHYHHLSIEANTIVGGRCQIIYPSTGTREKITSLRMTVEKPHPNVRRTYYFQPGNVATRLDITDRRDFRWIIDFESHYLYRDFLNSGLQKLPKLENAYSPKMAIPCGLFYTVRKTGSTFRMQPSDGTYVTNLGNVADVIGANVYVERNSAVTLYVNDVKYTVPAPGEVYFMNHCSKTMSGNDECDAQAYNVGDKTKRNDFYLHYKTFELEGKPEFELFLHDSFPQNAISGLVCDEGKFPIHRLTDEAPCAAGGYGGGGGLLP